MASLKNIFFAVSIITSIICEVAGISCYYCNSANNSACLDVNRYNDENIGRIIPIVNCDAATPVKMDFFCRKIVQTIFHTDREAESRVTRGCGWVRNEKKDCYRADNSDHLETACQCFTDLCNSADISADPASAVLLFLTLAAVLYFYR